MLIGTRQKLTLNPKRSYIRSHYKRLHCIFDLKSSTFAPPLVSSPLRIGLSRFLVWYESYSLSHFYREILFRSRFNFIIPCYHDERSQSYSHLIQKENSVFASLLLSPPSPSVLPPPGPAAAPRFPWECLYTICMNLIRLLYCNLYKVCMLWNDVWICMSDFVFQVH